MWKKLLPVLLIAVVAGCGKKEEPTIQFNEEEAIKQSQIDQEKAARGMPVPAG